MQALLGSHWNGWLGHANVQHGVALPSIHMIDARDERGLSDAGGDLDAACESCHQQFRYPSNGAAMAGRIIRRPV